MFVLFSVNYHLYLHIFWNILIPCKQFVYNMYLTSKQLVLFFIDQINKLRTHPRAFLQNLQSRLSRFNREGIYTRGDIPTLHYQTVEGDQAIKEAYDYLLSKEALQPLQLSYQLCEAAFAIGSDILQAYKQQDITTFQQKLVAQLSKNNCRAETLDVIIELGFGKDHELVSNIVIDDGDTSRSRRNALMDNRYKFIGLAVHEHNQFDYQLVIILANDVHQIYPESNASCQECQVM